MIPISVALYTLSALALLAAAALIRRQHQTVLARAATHRRLPARERRLP